MSVLKLLEKKKLNEEDLQSSDESSSETPEDIDGEEESAFKEPDEKEWKNRSRVLIVSGRGTAPGFRLMIKDIVDLLPHCKKEVEYSNVYLNRLKLTKRQQSMMCWNSVSPLHATPISISNPESTKTCSCGLESIQTAPLLNLRSKEFILATS
jgi:hypothetical protein